MIDINFDTPRTILLQKLSQKLITDHNKMVMFDTPVTIKFSPHTWPINIYGAEVGPGDGVWLMDSERQWHKLEEGDANFSLVANSILQRLNLLSSVKN